MRKVRWVMVALSLCLTVAGMPAQCSGRPAGLPASGVVQTLNNLVTYSDGYTTRADLLVPNVPLPAGCRWPLVVYVHGIGGTRLDGRAAQIDIAKQGFAVWAYDVRGQGAGQCGGLPGSCPELTFYGPVEKVDFAEQVQFVRTSFASQIAQNKLGVTGTSQGGVHSWFAAAYSGQTGILAPGRNVAVDFPTVDCVVPQHMVADIHDFMVLGSSLFEHNMFRRLISPPWNVDPGFNSTFQSFWNAQDPAGLRAAWAAEPDRLITPRLASTTVPILYHHAYLDQALRPQLALPAIATIPATTPVRAHLSTIGHDSPTNDYEAELQRVTRIRWFEKFLWDVDNEVEAESPFVLGVMPLRPGQRNDPSFLWGSVTR